MSRHDPLVALRHMLDYARTAVDISRERERASLDDDRIFSLALTRAVEIIGEAASRVPPEVRAVHPQVSWQVIIAARNRLIHGYDDVEHDLLWGIVAHDIPLLISQLEDILAAG